MEHLILESGGTISFVFHCLLILFFAFVLFNIYLNPKFIEDSGFKSDEATLMFKGPVGTIVLTFFVMSILLLIDITDNTTDHNIVQYQFFFVFLLMFFALLFLGNLLRFIGIFNLYGLEKKIQNLIFPGVGLVLVILKIATYAEPAIS
ncbi:MAG: hypothetical protein ISQ88_02900 [Rhodobacteraceae bacterium]|nr:hypothetical protein [Paracoccaceae bacterium]